MRTLSWLSFCVTAGALLCSAALLGTPELQAQNLRIAPRITTDVNESSLATLKDNMPRLARAEYDQGEASPSTQLNHVRLVLSRSSEQQAALDQHLAELQDKSSPNYHKWLTPEEFGQLYGPADSDIAALVAWLQSHGLTLETISKGRTNIAFSGTASQVEAAFHTSIHSFQTNGHQFYSNTTELQIPSALTAVVKGVAHLNTIRPRPQFVRGRPGKFNSQTKRIEPASTASPSLTFGSGSTSDPYLLYIVPGDAATIYDTPNTLNVNYTSGTSYTGSSVIIGVGGDAEINASIIKTYRSTFLGSAYATTPTLNYCTSSTSCSSTASGNGWAANSDDAAEAYLDTEISGGLAPGASIHYYASTDLTTGIEAAIDDNLVDIFSLSFGDCESDLGTSGNAQIYGYWEQAASQGIAVTVSTGDSGSAGCDYPETSSGNNVPDATGGLAVSGFASTPYNIAVGGTDFYALVDSFSTYVSESKGSASTYYRTAKSYIPESTWNESTYNDTTISENEPLSAAGYATSDNNIWAGSGGASAVYSRPAWQTGTSAVDSSGMRDLPDVSLMSGSGWFYAMWLVCDATYDCANISESGVDAYGGTSTAAPAFAGILALVEQKTGGRLGQAAQTLYDLHNGSHSSSIFHDVTVGNNSVPCTEGTPDCVENTAGYYFESGYNSGSGYDLASGLGSVDAKQLLTYWSTAIGSATATVNVTAPTPNPVTTAESLSVPVSVTGSSSLESRPTGTVTLSGGGYTSSAEKLVSGSYTFTVPAGDLSVGDDTLTVTYSGDTTYATATNTTTVEVTASSSSATFTLSAPNISSLTPGATTGNTVTVSATTTNGYTGTVVVTCALTTSPSGANSSYLPSCSGPVPTTPLIMGSAGSIFTINTTAATSAALLYPKLPGTGRGLFNLLGTGSGAALALLVFLGIPARRRSWRSMLGVLVLMMALGSLAACGGGGGGSSTSTSTGTSAGTYTFTVTGTGSDTNKTIATKTFTVYVN